MRKKEGGEKEGTKTFANEREQIKQDASAVWEAFQQL